MINTKSLEVLDRLRPAVLKLSVDGYNVLRFAYREPPGLPVIEIEVGCMSWDTKEKEGYLSAEYIGCLVIWKDSDISNKY